MSSRPHFLLTVGAWHSPDIWDPVRQKLTASGFDSTAIPLASLGRATYDMSEDVEAFHLAAKALVDQGKDVIVVLHSYGGQPGSDAMKGLGKIERAGRTGHTGGVVRMVFIMAWVLPEGFETAKRGDWAAFPNWMKLDHDTGLTTVSVEDAKKIFYNDMPDEAAEAFANRLQPWSIGCSMSTSTYAAWRTIPSTFVHCTNDASTFGPYARIMLDEALANKPCAIDKVEEVNAGHCVMISQPDWTAEMLIRAAREPAKPWV